MKPIDRLIKDINESWELALRSGGIDPLIIKECRTTVDDAISNNVDFEEFE